MKRIFIVGAPRSGTTLLQSMLSSHSSINSFTESHFFTNNFKSYKKLFYGVKKGINQSVEEFMKENKFDKELIQEWREEKKKTAKQYGKNFIKLLDQYTIHQKNKVWIEKTPAHLYFVPFIHKVCENAQFIHIVRDGKDVAASIYDVANRSPEIWGRRSLEQCVDRWNHDVEVSIKYLSRRNHFGVTYESLVDEPEKILKRLCHQLGIEWESNMLDFSSATSNLVTSKEKWKQNNYKGLTKHNRLNKLSHDQKEYVSKYINMNLYTKFSNLVDLE
ncbi:Sulfotransferase family protein [Salinibacillus kushneri]|uniref:Sulfotransferase family protein n=1 Tax=Salinibacillus kushneri TaxID=237682 RepID=A0A1I0JGY8_9BACI|nr:sulfotransferase [Salinibacillus kushneri]SEU09492.1 Sulfotransferase family protein [Salinibacillus kushneri]